VTEDTTFQLANIHFEIERCKLSGERENCDSESRTFEKMKNRLSFHSSNRPQNWSNDPTKRWPWTAVIFTHKSDSQKKEISRRVFPK
jgi:hypothetical protein